jgi:diadenosine tetraphosphatase ApaH/serine/threonine PP2A family protein phosphatase
LEVPPTPPAASAAKSVDIGGGGPKIDGLRAPGQRCAGCRESQEQDSRMFAIVSDIHSNLEAFQAVLEDIGAAGASSIICLGDVIGYGANPKECLDIAMRFEFTIMGNHDQAVLYEPMNFNVGAERASFWTRGQLEDEPDEAKRTARWGFLGSMLTRKEVGELLFVHGSPRRPTNEYIFADDIYYSPARVSMMFEQVSKVCFVGHSHVPGVFLGDPDFFTPDELDVEYVYGKEKAIVNVGSVGQPRDRDPRASYVLVDPMEKRIKFRRVQYDLDKTVAKILAVPDLDDFLAHRLKDGR